MIVDIIKRTTVIDVRLGPRGRAGINGTNGQGVPTGGTTGQILAKNSGTNYDTGWINLNLTWEGISGKPSTFPPSAHNQAWATITGTPTTLAGYGIADGITAAAAAAAYAPIDHTQAISTITGLQSALDGKAATVEPSFESAITITDINDPANNGSELNGILIESNRDSLAQYQQQIVFGNGDKMGRMVAPALVSDYEWYLPQSTGSIMLDSDNTGGIDATRLTSGTINTARLPGTVLLAGGALGTPSSGVLTNCTNIPAENLTGTINTARLPGTITGLTSVTSTNFLGSINGAIGASTPNTGVFTTITSSGAGSFNGTVINASSITPSNANFQMSASGVGVARGVPIYFSFGGANASSAFISSQIILDDTVTNAATGALAVRLGTAAQSWRVYNTWTSATNNELGVMDWKTTANTFRVGTDKGSGGGSNRPVQIIMGGTVKITLLTDGNILLHGLPASAPATSNAIWRDDANGGVLKQVA